MLTPGEFDIICRLHHPAATTIGVYVQSLYWTRQAAGQMGTARVDSVSDKAATSEPDFVRPTLPAMVPFLVVGATGFISTLVPPYGDGSTAPWLALVILGVACGCEWVALHRPVRTWVDPVGSWLVFLAIALMRDATGGSTSGLAPLVALPVLWLAIFGTRSDLLVAAALTAATFVLPVWLIGAPTYSSGDWRRALLWTLVVLLVAPVIQRVVRQLSIETAREREASAQVAGIMRGATLASLIATDPEGTITSFGVGAEQLLGYRAEAVVGRETPGLFHDPDEVVAAAAELGVEPGFGVFAALAAQGDPSRIWTFVHADGRRLSVRLVVTELRGHDGALVGYLGVAIDSTAAVETERELAAAEERWRAVMNHLPDTTVVVIDAALRIQMVTGAGAMGQGLAEAGGKQLEEVSNAENAAVIADLIRGALAGEEMRGEIVAPRTGAEHELQTSLLPSTGDTDPHVILLARDVSRDRAREREVARARDRAERLFEESPRGIALAGLDGVLVQANPVFCELFAQSEADLIGRPLAALGSTDDGTIDQHLQDLVSSLNGRSEAPWEVIRPDGQSSYLTLSSILLTGESQDHPDLALVNVVDVTERHNYEAQLAHLADHDPLTGLANRRRFADELDRHLDYCRRYGYKGALLLLDLDNFKEVNDTLGHSTGDQLIISVATLLGQAVRATDLVARLGGDEFAILLHEVDRPGAELVAEGIVTRIRDHVRTLEGTQRRVTASVGVVLVDHHNESATELIAAADMTMYDAKDAGRNQWVTLDYAVFEQPKSGARLAWRTRIEDAIDNDDLVLHLQPILDVKRGLVTGAEALLRLSDGPELVYPGRFVYVAERTGLIVKLDAWVLTHAIEILADLQRLQPNFRLEVNLSGLSIGKREIERTIIDSLLRTGADPRGLVLEITETAAVADVETARAFAQRVTALGCRFALDDFGAGFGSFYYLKHLLFDYIKIDGEFISNCHRNPTDRTILRSIVSIAQGLGKRTIAEFVSEPEILDVITAEGVDFAQGYHVGRPVPLEDFISSLV